MNEVCNTIGRCEYVLLTIQNIFVMKCLLGHINTCFAIDTKCAATNRIGVASKCYLCYK